MSMSVQTVIPRRRSQAERLATLAQHLAEGVSTAFEFVVDILVDARTTMRHAHRPLPFGSEWR